MVRRLAVVVVSLFVLLGVFEGVLRAREAQQQGMLLAGRSLADLGTLPADPPLLYTLKPQWKADFNSRGFRDVERSKAKGQGVFRMAIVGDSVTMQMDIPFEKLYARRLERLLNEVSPDRAVECPIFAVTGYCGAQALELMKETVLDYEPDAILWQFHLNDAADPVIDGDNGGLGRFYSRPRFQVLATLRRKIDHIGKDLWLKRHYPGLQQRDLQIQAWRWNETQRMIEQARALSVAKKVPVYVVLFPSFPAGGNWEQYSEADMTLYTALVERFERAGFPTLDLMPIFKAYSVEEIQREPGDPWHPNARGHAIMARSIRRWLIDQGFQAGSMTSKPPM